MLEEWHTAGLQTSVFADRIYRAMSRSILGHNNQGLRLLASNNALLFFNSQSKTN
jgi:hypothetical protein